MCLRPTKRRCGLLLVGVYIVSYIQYIELCSHYIEFLRVWYFQSHHGDTLLNFGTVTERVSIFQACVCIDNALGVNIQLCAWILKVIVAVGVAKLDLFFHGRCQFSLLVWLTNLPNRHFQMKLCHFHHSHHLFISLPVLPSPRLLPRRPTLRFRSRELCGAEENPSREIQEAKFQSRPFPSPFDR